MANPTWPATLPAYVLQEGYSEKLPNFKIETQMEAGPPKTRRRFSTNWRAFTVTIKLDLTQRAIFEDFYVNTLNGGTGRFDWVHPVTRATATFRFRNPPPQYSVEGGNRTIANFALDQLA